MKKVFTLILISLAGYGVQAQNLNGGFEAWRSSTVFLTTVRNPIFWNSSDSLLFTLAPIAGISNPQPQVTRSTNSNSGTYAAQLMSRQQDTFGVLPALLTNADISVNFVAVLSGDYANAFALSGGTAVTQRMIFAHAYVKYTPSGNDTASMVLNAIKTFGTVDSVIGFGAVNITSTGGNYVLTGAPISYIDSTLVPDKIQIVFTSSISTNAQDSSTLLVDDVSLSTTAIAEVSNENFVSCYPNPSNGNFYLNSSVNEKLTFMAYNMNGQVVATRDFTGKAHMDVSTLPSGLYFYHITDQNGTILQRSKLTIVK